MRRKAIIIDLDGTLVHDPIACHYKWTNPGDVDWDEWHKSRLYLPRNTWCYDIVKNFYINNYVIIYLTGRGEDGIGRQIAQEWLSMHSPTQDYELIMRPEDNIIPDSILKEQIYREQIAPKYEVVFAIDDKRDVCEMWSKLGIPYLYCGDMHIVTYQKD